MPRAKKTATTNGATQAVNKMAAVRQALAGLGRKAKPRAIQSFLKEQAGIDMDVGLISNYKYAILKKAGRRKKAAAKNGAAERREAVARGTVGISISDIRTVMELTRRLGAKNLCGLVEALAR